MKLKCKADFLACVRSYQLSSLVQKSVNRGLLAFLKSKRSLEDLASEIRESPEVTATLLDALKELALVCQSAGQWELTSLGHEVANDRFCQAASAYHSRHALNWFNALPYSARREADIDRQFFLIYMQAMDAIACDGAASIRSIWGLEECRSIVDVACGPAAITRSWARERGKNVVGYDLPVVQEFMLSAAPKEREFRFFGLDFWADLSEVERADGVFCSHFVEYCPESKLSEFFERLTRFGHSGGRCALIAILRPSRPSLAHYLHSIETTINGRWPIKLHTQESIVSAIRSYGHNISVHQIPEGSTHSRVLISFHWN